MGGSVSVHPPRLSYGVSWTIKFNGTRSHWVAGRAAGGDGSRLPFSFRAVRLVQHIDVTTSTVGAQSAISKFYVNGVAAGNVKLECVRNLASTGEFRTADNGNVLVTPDDYWALEIGSTTPDQGGRWSYHNTQLVIVPEFP